MKAVSQGPFVRGLHSSSQVLAQPKGTVSRISNLLYTKRGGLTTCDGTQIVQWFNGAVQNNRGPILSIVFFSPVGVAPYLLFLSNAPDQHLGAPTGLAATDGGAGGTLSINTTYYYKVVALDGQAVLTTASAEANFAQGGAAHKVVLTWKSVPNATCYQIFRSTSAGAEANFLNVISAPFAATVIQPSPITQTATYTDDGSAATLAGTIPGSDITSQLGLYQAATGSILPINYNSTTTFLVALFPSIAASLGPASVGISVTPASPVTGSTPSGGLAGASSLLPQLTAFQNQMLVALGNGFAPQVYSDNTTTGSNPAKTGTVASASENSDGGVGNIATYTATGHGLVVGQQVVISGFATAGFNGVFQVMTVVDANNFTARNTAAAASAIDNGGGKLRATVTPFASLFVATLPSWVATTAYATGSLITAGSPAHVFKAIQGGTSGSGGAPTFSTVTGGRTTDNNIIWQESGLLNATAPPPPGCGHIAVFSSAVWVWDTSPTNTANGLDGPTCLRMSDVNNVNSWNPINQAFIDKDDGTEGMGLASFTITAQGIPPQGSLVAFKLRATYQIQGIFGASNFAIQRIRSDMGCIAPRTIQFCPGFGLIRLTHNGFAAFDGVDDRVISEEIRPYLFPTTDTDSSDITPMNGGYAPLAFAAQTAAPAMYVCAIPLGNTTAALARICCYDLTLKTWTIIDLPFNISCISQITTNYGPLTLTGGFGDGTIQRWQAGDAQWKGGAASPADVSWNFRPAEMASKEANQRIYCRRVVIRGISTSSSALTVTPRVGGTALAAQTTAKPAVGDFDLFVTVDRTGLRFDATIAGTKIVEIDDIGWHLEPRPVGVAMVAA
jgi:hypothetical protein